MKSNSPKIQIIDRSAVRYCLAAALLAVTSLHAAPPAVTGVSASQRDGTKLVDVYYTVSGTAPFTVRLEISTDNGNTFTIPATTVSGDAGAGISAGAGKHIVWNAGVDWDGNYTDQCKAKVIATDASVPASPAGMVMITAGGSLGSSQVSAFYLERFEVTHGLYANVLAWGLAHDYQWKSGYSGAGSDHPVVNVSWFDCVKWCNARSEKEGLAPCYYTDEALTAIYKQGDTVDAVWVKWNASGYRLPTEAEWHHAAAGHSVTIYHWGDTMTGADGNLSGSGDPFESGSPPTTPVGYYNGTTYALEGGDIFATNNRVNAFGLYDMIGNVWEWCWDWYGDTYPVSTADYRGPDTGGSRLLRGGSWNGDSSNAALADRYGGSPSNAGAYVGFRCARGL